MKRLFIILVFSLIFAVSSFAQEGMWLLSQLDQLDLNKKGLQIETSDIFNKDKPSLYNAVVILDGGTASFVSSEGLLITNHHVAFAGLQRAATKDNDLITNGFLAKSRSDEIKAPDYAAQLLIEIKDVTNDVLDAGKNISDITERENAITKKITEMTEAISKNKEDITANIAEMYNGKQYILFVYKTFKDVRLVYCPPRSIGEFGGETDNWMWPRHTGDFSFLRVYASPEGTGKEYCPDNVPYKPKVWLKVAKEGLKEGDFTFILGYPGTTTRYRTSNSVDWNQNVNYPFSIKNFREIIDLSLNLTKNDNEGRIKVSSLVKGLSNGMKNYEGKVAGMKKINFLQKKKDFEKEFSSWVNKDQGRVSKYGDIFKIDDELYSNIAKTKDRDLVFGIFQGLASTQLGIAMRIYGIKYQLEKPESERLPGFTEKGLQETFDNLEYAYANYYEPVDKALLVRALKMANELPQDQRIKGLEYIFNDKSKTIEQFVDDAFNASKLKDLEYTKSLSKLSVKELEALNDPFIKMAASMNAENNEIQMNGLVFNAKVTDLRKRYIDGLFEWKGTGMYPDANRTLRFTSGNIKGYSPADGVWYLPFTTLKGVIQKNTGEEPFNVPDKLTELYNKKDYGRWEDPNLKDVPVAFTHQCDITGGNSGSPVMNAKGELIGLAFDGNYEAMISDWQYDFDLQRVISVDIRYVLFITEKFSNAGFILNEMGVSHPN